MTALRTTGGVTPQHKELIDQAAQAIAQDNTELACAYIQKTAVEKAIPEIEKRLAPVGVFCLHHFVQSFYNQKLYRLAFTFMYPLKSIRVEMIL